MMLLLLLFFQLFPMMLLSLHTTTPIIRGFSPFRLYTTSLSNSEDIKTINLLDRQRGTLMGFYIADALAVPTHWIYNRQQLREEYGFIQGYLKPKDILKDSKLVLRYRYDKVIADSLILHEKRSLWRIESTAAIISSNPNTNANVNRASTTNSNADISQSQSQQQSNTPLVINKDDVKATDYSNHYHYHTGLNSGDNTLEALLTRLLTRNIIQHKRLNHDSFRQDYVQFMTTRNTHNDSYAFTCHRMFFYNYYYKNLSSDQCADNDYHNIDSIDGLLLTIPVIFQYYSAPRMIRLQAIKQTIYLTRKTRVLDQYAELYSDMLMSILTGTHTLKEAIEKCGSQLNSNNDDDDDDGLSGFRSIKYMVETNRKNPISKSKNGSLSSSSSKNNNNDNNRNKTKDYDNQCNNNTEDAMLSSSSSSSSSYGNDNDNNNDDDPTTACYIQPAFISLLYLAYKYADAPSPDAGLLANANTGGENVSRGSLLGTLLGAAHGYSKWPQWCIDGLTATAEIRTEIDQLLSMSSNNNNSCSSSNSNSSKNSNNKNNDNNNSSSNSSS